MLSCAKACETRVQRTGVRKQKPFSEMFYYLSRRDWSASALLDATRSHWQIENGSHWVKEFLNTFLTHDQIIGRKVDRTFLAA